ncbi:MAG: DUF6438 domain-containing protein [bacterium]|nr:DUF6438 domain-containing protein [bacterium]
MKKLSYILSLLLLAFALQACKTSEEVVDVKETVNEAPAEGTDITQEEVPVASDSTADRSVFASIERTPCFGRCPTYKMTIYSDGFVEFNGIRDVDMIGKYTTTITQGQMNAILKKAEEIEFFTFEDEYDDGMITDLPSTTTTVLGHDGQLKSVMRRHGYPKRILTLEQLFDDLMTSERWTSESGEIYPPER